MSLASGEEVIYISSKPEVSGVVDLIRMGLNMTPDLFESSPLALVIGFLVTLIVAVCSFGKSLAKNPQSLAIFMVAFLPEKRAARVQKLTKTFGLSEGKE